MISLPSILHLSAVWSLVELTSELSVRPLSRCSLRSLPLCTAICYGRICSGLKNVHLIVVTAAVSILFFLGILQAVPTSNLPLNTEEVLWCTHLKLCVLWFELPRDIDYTMKQQEILIWQTLIISFVRCHTSQHSFQFIIIVHTNQTAALRPLKVTSHTRGISRFYQIGLRKSDHLVCRHMFTSETGWS